MITELALEKLRETTFLQGVRYFEKTDSTNSQASELVCSPQAPMSSAAMSSAATPLLVYAESQTAGRGRGTNRWWSQSGSLTFSVVIDVDQFGLTPELLIKLPLVTGMAVLRTGDEMLENLGVARKDFALKWPNDVYLASRKLAGILIEVPATITGARHAVIGVGLNVNNSWKDAPADLEGIGISLADCAGTQLDRREVLQRFLVHLEKLIRSLSAGDPVLADWASHCMLTGSHVTLLVGDEEVSGECLGIANNGALLLGTTAGVQQFLGGVVKSWK